ncbi:ankyrin homolog [Haliotis cracherodii]|uniref:ankyrin homolog n=1 Tax=Haliotis cracherodii TaxID=6455 RepID=UPI0039ED2A8E
MAEHQEQPETPPEPKTIATVKSFEQLYSLISNGDAKTVIEYLDHNHITPETYTSLVQDRYYSQLRYSPVATAARTGQLDIMKALIAHGFNPEETSRNLTGKNEYPIHLACAANQIAVVKSLIEDYGVCVDTRDSGDSTPMFWAILTENMDMLKLLVDAGADVNSTFHDTMTPLLFAAFMINSLMCEYLMENGANVNDTGDCGNTPLCLSVRCVSTSRVLIDAGADIDHINSQGDTPLILASKRNYRNTVELLGSRGACADIQDKEGRTALHHAVDRDHNKIAEYLIGHLNVQLDVLDNLGRTAFYMAFFQRNAELVELLIQAGADPGKEDIVYEDDPGDKEHPVWYAVVKDCRRIGRNSRTLQHLCRFKVRSMFGRDINTAIKTLPLPQTVKDDLALLYYIGH